MATIGNAEFEELDESALELDLAADTSLPWLESDDDEGDAGGLDNRQIIGFAGGLLALAALLIGIVWYGTNKVSGDAIIPDGSTIAAPAGPIKERPDDPGGKEFAGTGSVAPLVGEGEAPQSMVASPAKPVALAPDPAAKGTRVTPPADAGAAAAQPAEGGVGVQLAAYTSRERAEQGWADISRRSPALQGARYRVVEGKVDAGTVFRLQAVTADRAGADQLCKALKREGLDCQVKP